MLNSKYSKIIFPFILLGILFASYCGVGELGFVWDDEAFLVERNSMRGGDALQALWFKPFFISYDYYRPLVVISYALQYQYFGLDAESFHWMNLALHCFNCLILWCVFLGVRRLKPFHYCWAMVGTAFYALHPVLVEAVAWVSGRFDLLMTSFLLLGLLVDLQVRNVWLKSLGVGLCFLLAALSKEAAVGFALAYPFWRMFIYLLVKDNDEKLTNRFGSWKVYFSIIFAGLLYLFLRYASMGYLLSGSVYNDYGNGLQRLLLTTKAFMVYLWMSVFPFGKVSPFHFQLFPLSTQDTGGWVALILFFSLLITGGLAWLNNRRLFFPAFVAYFLALLPALHLFQTPLQDNLVQERYLQFPLAFFTVFSCLLLREIWADRRTLFKYFIFGLYGLFVVASFANIRVTVPLWKDSISLWTWASLSSPESSGVWANLAAAYQQIGENAKAEQAVSKSLELNPRPETKASALVILGNVESLNGRLDKAAEKYLESFVESKTNPSALINMVNVLIRMKEFETAKWYLDIAENFDKTATHPYFFFNYGLYWLALGDKLAAKEMFEKGESLIDVSRRAGYEKLANEYLTGKRHIEYWAQGIK